MNLHRRLRSGRIIPRFFCLRNPSQAGHWFRRRQATDSDASRLPCGRWSRRSRGRRPNRRTRPMRPRKGMSDDFRESAMRKIREVLRLKHALGASERRIAVSAGISRSTIGEYLRRAAVIGINGGTRWRRGDELDTAARRATWKGCPLRNCARAKPMARARRHWCPVELAAGTPKGTGFC